MRDGFNITAYSGNKIEDIINRSLYVLVGPRMKTSLWLAGSQAVRVSNVTFKIVSLPKVDMALLSYKNNKNIVHYQ